MTPEKTPKQPPASAWKPPRGITYSFRPERPTAPFYLHWRIDGRRKKTAYETAAIREKAAKKLAEDRKTHGRAVMEFDPSEWLRWTRFRELIGDTDPVEVAKFWIEKGGPRGGPSKTPVNELITRYLTARETAPGKKASLAHTRGDLARFNKAFGTRPADEVSADLLREWLRSLPYAPTTKRNHHKHGAALYNWAIREGLFDGKNPFRNVEKPPMTTGEVSTLTPEQTATLFSTAQTHRPAACARLALEFFAGIRHSTAAQFERHEVDLVARGLRIPAAKIKTNRPEYIDELPPNLWTWLAAATDASWALCGKDYERAKSDVFRLAGFANPGNVARHSFCSYHVALHRDAAATAVILCHTSPRTLYRHYKGIATAADAARYFAIACG